MATPILAYSIAFMIDATITLGGRPILVKDAGSFAAPLSTMQLAAVIPVSQVSASDEAALGPLNRDAALRAQLQPGNSVIDAMDTWSFEVAGRLIAEGRAATEVR